MISTATQVKGLPLCPPFPRVPWTLSCLSIFPSLSLISIGGGASNRFRHTRAAPPRLYKYPRLACLCICSSSIFFLSSIAERLLEWGVSEVRRRGDVEGGSARGWHGEGYDWWTMRKEPHLLAALTEVERTVIDSCLCLDRASPPTVACVLGPAVCSSWGVCCAETSGDVPIVARSSVGGRVSVPARVGAEGEGRGQHEVKGWRSQGVEPAPFSAHLPSPRVPRPAQSDFAASPSARNARRPRLHQSEGNRPGRLRASRQQRQ